MALQFILGGSGAGKSYYLYHKIIEESMKDEKTNYLVIVPEQFTMETQKDFVTMHPRHGIMNIDVLSFMRLAYRIIEETGKGRRPVLEDAGKMMVLLRVLEEKKSELVYFKSNIKKPGFVDEMKSLLSELYQYSVNEEQLEYMISLAEKKPMLKGKLKDILTIYRGFREFMEEKYITLEEIMDVLYDALEESGIVKDCVIALDGFTGFTPSQYKVLERLISQAKMVYVTITVDEREDITRRGEEYKLFHLSKTTLYKFFEMAKDLRVELLDPIYPSKGREQLYRFLNNGPMGALERNLFRYPWTSYELPQESISIHSLKNPRQEVRFAVEKIKSLVRQKGCRYRDFGVVTGDMEGYGKIIEREFTAGGVPFFLDSKRNILENPMVVMILGVLEAAERNMDYESTFYYIRCGMLSISYEEIDKLDNYVRALGIRGFKKWEKPFSRVYEGIEKEDLEELNVIRNKVMEGLLPARELFFRGKQKVISYAQSLYDFILHHEAFEKLLKFQELFLKNGEDLKAKEYDQVYQKVMEVLERTVELLGEEELSIREFADLLKTGFGKAEVGLIPSRVDQVMAGDMERTRLKDIKVLFFLGVNDGVIPKGVQGGGILSDAERELLKDKKIELAPGTREKVYTEQFYLYLNLTKPSDQLFLTYCNVANSGKTAKPSYLVGRILKMFPDMEIIEEEEKSPSLEGILGCDKGMEYLLSGILRWEEEDVYWDKLYSFYMEHKEEYPDVIRYIEAGARGAEASSISKAVAKALYGENMVGSITRLEQFAACACAHFLSYGLKLKERKEFKLEAPDMGNIFHSALELFSKKLEMNGLTWQSVSEEEWSLLGEECAREIASEYGNTILHSSRRNEYMIERISRILKRTLWAITRQLKAGDFIPKGYELSFSYLDHLDSLSIPLNGHHKMTLTGRIDRMDVWEEDENIYVKVVDYKSGKKAFDIVDLYYGLQLQLVVYMGTALEKTQKDYPDKNVVPAGVFYYHIDDPVVDKTSEEFLEDSILKELKVNGLVNGEEKIVKALDHNFSGEEGLMPGVKSVYIPVETLKDGSLSKNSSVAFTKDFKNLTAFARKTMKKLGDEILDGKTEANPYQLGDRTACDYCKFDGVCGFDKRLYGNSYRVLAKKSKDEIWREISEQDEMDQGPEKGN